MTGSAQTIMAGGVESMSLIPMGGHNISPNPALVDTYPDVQLHSDKVKATIFFRGREMAHPEIGRRILERLVDELADVAVAETMPRLEGNQMHTILSRRPQGGGGRAKPAASAAAKS